MTDPRRQAFAPYLRCLADLIGLRDWTVGIEDGPPDDAGHVAECDARNGRKILWLRLSEAFLDATPDRQRQTLVHELLHGHTAHLEHLVWDGEESAAHKAVMLALEYAIDGIAEEWAKTLPLPGEVEEAGGEPANPLPLVEALKESPSPRRRTRPALNR